MMSSIIDIKTLKTSEIIVYDTPEQLVIDLVEPNHSIRLMEVPDEKNVSYLLPKIEKESTIKLHQNFTSINSNQIIDFKGKKIGICRDTTSMTTEAKLDLCIIRDSSIKMQMLTNCSKIIMPRFIESKNYEIDKLNQEKTLFLIRHKGAYILKF